MSYQPTAFRHHVRFLKQQFLQDGDLPVTDVLSESLVAKALTKIQDVFYDRIFSPW